MSTPSRQSLKDEEIVRLIVHEERRELFGILYSRYQGKIRDKAFSLLKDRLKAEEITAEILSRVYEKLSGFKGNSSFSSWIYSITYNYCIDYLRLKKKLHYPDWNKDHAISEIPIESDEDISGVTYEKLMEILDRIHPEEKALILMKYQDDFSLKQIAASLRITEDAVKMRLKRARTRIVYIYKQHFARQ